MEPGTIVTIAVVAMALLGIWLLPLRKRWNDDGAADEVRRQAVERDLGPAPVLAPSTERNLRPRAMEERPPEDP